MKVLKKSPSGIPLLAEALRSGRLICAPTDTLYGVLGTALDSEAVSKVYRLKGRSPAKPLIVLFDCVESIERYGVDIPQRFKEGLVRLYPAPVTVVLPLKKDSPFRAVFSRTDIAVRVPDDPFLRTLIARTSPLFAPSANPEGEKPAESCEDCLAYFGSELAWCVEGKPVYGKPSTLVSLLSEQPRLLRSGAVDFSAVVEVLT